MRKNDRVQSRSWVAWLGAAGIDWLTDALHEHESNKSLQYNDNQPSNPVHLHQAKLADQLFKCKYRIKKLIILFSRHVWQDFNLNGSLSCCHVRFYWIQKVINFSVWYILQGKGRMMEGISSIYFVTDNGF